MTIEITDQMIYAFAGEPEITATDAHAIRVGLAAALALVEQDYPATEYTLRALPEGDINGMHFQITVAYRGRGLWAVLHFGQCLTASGEWDWESIPSERTDEWLAQHRFPLAEALRLAREELPKLRVNGLTAAEVAEWAAQRRAEAAS